MNNNINIFAYVCNNLSFWLHVLLLVSHIKITRLVLTVTLFNDMLGTIT